MTAFVNQSGAYAPCKVSIENVHDFEREVDATVLLSVSRLFENMTASLMTTTNHQVDEDGRVQVPALVINISTATPTAVDVALNITLNCGCHSKKSTTKKIIDDFTRMSPAERLACLSVLEFLELKPPCLNFVEQFPLILYPNKLLVVSVDNAIEPPTSFDVFIFKISNDRNRKVGKRSVISRKRARSSMSSPGSADNTDDEIDDEVVFQPTGESVALFISGCGNARRYELEMSDAAAYNVSQVILDEVLRKLKEYTASLRTLSVALVRKLARFVAQNRDFLMPDLSSRRKYYNGVLELMLLPAFKELMVVAMSGGLDPCNGQQLPTKLCKMSELKRVEVSKVFHCETDNVVKLELDTVTEVTAVTD